MALIRDRRPAEAYQLLAPLAKKDPKDVRLHVVLGMAALDSGQAEAAIDAFSRALQASPRLTAVRTDLGRAYLAAGRYVDARREFRQALADNPPEFAVPFIQNMLATAEVGARVETDGVLTSYVEAGLGHDSNITAVTSNFTSGVQGTYGLPGFQPTGNSILRSGSYAQTTAGVDYIKPLNPAWAFTAGLNGLWRGYDGFSAYNQSSTDLRVGTLYARDRHLLRFNLTGQRYDQQTETPGTPRPTADRRTTGLSADWRYNLDALYSIGLFVAANQMRFPDNTVLDTDEIQIGYSLTRRIPEWRNAALTLSPSYTEDRATNKIPGSATGADYSKTVVGSRLSGQFDLSANVTAFASFGYFTRKDASDFARSTLFTRGIDKQSDLSIGASWRFARDWSARAQVSRTENRSNLPLYSYDRTETFVGVRRDFR